MKMVSMSRLIPLILAVCPLVGAETAILPLKHVRAGMKGIGKTVFSGTQIENFSVEVLGVLENVGPKQSIILARLSGGPLDRTGVLQGMSGSPVYVDGKLIGAVAMAFPFSKEPVAGIRPIEEMFATAPSARHGGPRVQLTDPSLVARLPKTRLSPDHPADIATPLTLSGFTRSTIETFAPQLRQVGMELQQGISGGRSPRPVQAPPLQPGAMITVQLASGDMSVGADGTVTHIDGNRVYAFGHRFLSVGNTELPFTTSSVIALLSNLSTSFKIAASGQPLGTITGDYNAAVSGELGRKAKTAPVTISVMGAARDSRYKMEIIQDQMLSPLLLQMMVYSALDASERTLGSSSVRLRGTVRFEGAPDPVKIDNMYSGDFNVPLVASLGTALPVAYALQNTVDTLKLQSVDLTLDAVPEKKQFSIENVWTSRRQVRPGEAFEISVLLVGDGNRELVRQVRYEVPIGAPVGPLNITVADGPTTNASEGRVYSLAQPRPASQVIPLLNSLRGSTRGYVRLWRQDPTYTLEGQELPAPPPSVGMILARLPVAAAVPGRSAAVAEIPFDAADAVISGSKTIQVEVRE
jgi:hypothetical protein